MCNARVLGGSHLSTPQIHLAPPRSRTGVTPAQTHTVPLVRKPPLPSSSPGAGWPQEVLCPSLEWQLDLGYKETQILALAGVAQWIEHPTAKQNVASLIPVRAHAWVSGQVPGWGCVRGNQSMFLCTREGCHFIPSRACAWVVPGWLPCEKQLIDVSLPFSSSSLLFSLKINK